MNRIVSFNKNGHDPFIDFLKSYAIICVLVAHTFPFLNEIGYSLWAGMQVPIFILIQAFHVLKKDSPHFNFVSVIRRIFLPFAIITLITVAILYTIQFFVGGGNVFTISELCKRGGVGPGSYYPWIFLQIAILLPVIKPFFEKIPRFLQILSMIGVCEILEIFESLIGMPEYLHRLIAIRYLFLIFLGWVWVKDGIVINTKTLILSIISLLSVIYFEYFSGNSEPWFYNTSWKFHRWPCYYYVSVLLCYILFCIYGVLSKFEIINKASCILAKCSYEIFLVQMALIAIIPNFGIAWMIFIFCSSITGGYFFHKAYSNICGLRIFVAG